MLICQEAGSDRKTSMKDLSRIALEITSWEKTERKMDFVQRKWAVLQSQKKHWLIPQEGIRLQWPFRII